MLDQFINSQETLLVWTEHGEHISNAENVAKTEAVLGYADEAVERFFRIDSEWNFEDVTEQVAQAWLDKHGEHPDEMNVSGHGAWLENSQALEDYIDGWEDERSDYDEHNTMNHAQQGV